MFKLLRNKIQSLNKTQQGILTAILAVINLGIVIFLISLSVGLIKTHFPPMIKEEPTIEQERPIIEIIQDLTAPERKEPISEKEKQEEKQRLEKALESLTAPKK